MTYSYAKQLRRARTKTLHLRNRQRVRSVNLKLLRQIALSLLEDSLSVQSFELGIHLVDTAQITPLNEHFLHHAGSTDVITFNYAGQSNAHALEGDVIICVTDAVAQARHFGTTWQSELVRYLVHGVLHLQGHDDATAAGRRKMKRQEDRLLEQLGRLFPLRGLAIAKERHS